MKARRTWKRLPPAQRKRIADRAAASARVHGPILARKAAETARTQGPLVAKKAAETARAKGPVLARRVAAAVERARKAE